MSVEIVQAGFWVLAGVISFYFSLGNARVWTSIAVGFFLVLVGEVIPQAVPFLPGAGIPRVDAMASIIGTIAIMAMTHGFQEYYVFSRTLEIEGRRSTVYLVTLLTIFASLVFLLINPVPTPETLRTIRIVENTNWVFLALINIDMIRKIYLNVRETPIAGGFLCFIAVFICIFLWKGAALYMQVFGDSIVHLVNYQISLAVQTAGNFLSAIMVGITFLYLARQLR